MEYNSVKKMRTFEKQLVRCFALLPGVLLAAACGGSVFESKGGQGGDGSGSGSAGQPSGGATSYAGSGVTAGAAGSGIAGASVAGTTGSAGSGGSGLLDFTVCSSSSQCEVVPATCCSCGLGPVSNYTAINSANDAQFKEQCQGRGCGCPSVAFDPNNPVLYYVATCQKPADAPDGVAAGHCVVVDLRATGVTSCKVPADCSLRAGTACCPGCSVGQPVAINSSQEEALEGVVCGKDPIVCDLCLPTFGGYDATCSDGRCAVELTPCTAQHPCPL
jgi:hypothetical protein